MKPVSFLTWADGYKGERISLALEGSSGALSSRNPCLGGKNHKIFNREALLLLDSIFQGCRKEVFRHAKLQYIHHLYITSRNH